jgi:hypothetical protein
VSGRREAAKDGIAQADGLKPDFRRDHGRNGKINAFTFFDEDMFVAPPAVQSSTDGDAAGKHFAGA